VAVDPGVRTFATTYSADAVAKYGEGLMEALTPIHREIDGLTSVRRKLLNLKSEAQWCKDRL